VKWLPRHRHIENVLSERVGGTWKVGDKIPPEGELCREFGVSRLTIEKALSSLVRRGIIRRWRGRGSYVISLPRQNDFGKLTGSLDDMVASGHRVRAKVLERKAVILPPELQKLFNLSENDAVGILIRRVMLVNDEPLAVLTGHLPFKVGNELDEQGLESKTMSALLTEIGRPPQMVEQVVEAVAADPEIGSHLEVNPGTPLLRIQRIFYSRGQAVHHSVSLYRPDRYRYVQSLERTRRSVVHAAVPRSET